MGLDNPFHNALKMVESLGYERPTPRNMLINAEHFNKCYNKFIMEMRK